MLTREVIHYLLAIFLGRKKLHLIRVINQSRDNMHLGLHEARWSITLQVVQVVFVLARAICLRLDQDVDSLPMLDMLALRHLESLSVECFPAQGSFLCRGCSVRGEGVIGRPGLLQHFVF